MKRNCFLLTLLVGCVTSALAADALDIVAAGFDEYIKQGADAAWKTWTTGARLEENKSVKEGFDKASKAATLKLGKSIGRELISVRQVSPSIRIEYYVWKFERGPLYIRFNCYNNGKQWLIDWIQCSDILEDIIPAEKCHTSHQD